MSHIYTAATTLLALLLYLVLTTVVGQARGKYGIKAPAAPSLPSPACGGG